MRRLVHRALWLFLHKPPWKPILIWGPWIAVLLVLAFYAIENWRGQRALDRAMAHAAERGYSLRWKDSVPPLIPDEENLAKSPLFDLLGNSDDYRTANFLMKTGRAPAGISTERKDFRKPRNRPLLLEKVDVRLWLESAARPPTEREAAIQLDAIFAKRKEFLDELHNESERKSIVITAHPEDFLSPDSETTGLLMRGLSIYRICEEDARLACLQGDIERALSRIQINNAFLDAEGTRILLDLLIKASITVSNYEIAEHILRSGEASLAQLNQLDDLLSRSLMTDFDKLVFGELAFAHHSAEHLIENRDLLTTADPLAAALASAGLGSSPSGWERALQRTIDFFLRRIPSGWIRGVVAENIDTALQQTLDIDFATAEGRQLYGTRLEASPAQNGFRSQILGQNGKDLWYNPFKKLNRFETERDLMQVAIRLEKYRAQRGRYPLTLTEIGTLPLDYYSGAPFQYVLKEDGTPHLWSIGPDRIDDGGLPRQMSGNDKKGDLVWMLTPIPGLTAQEWRRATR